ncbi:MAG: CotH kinase family protein [Chitinophagaceae bacterium]|nr:CotH kinase family protein [Chitinophagaceae bacterium]
MLRKIYTLILLLLTSVSAKSQCSNNVNHWESAVLANNTWRYLVPTMTIPNWETTSFNDATWLQGTGGFGFGDNDDNTVLTQPVTSVYIRKQFNIVDTSVIQSMILCMDYDDGFVAYLNGKEIARSNLNAPTLFNDLATLSHEANLYQSQQPEYFSFSSLGIDTLLVNGNNVLAIEVHNFVANSDDLSSNAFLQLGISNSTFNYQPTPVWFQPQSLLQTHLPIVKINTLGQTILDDPRIICDMRIIDNGPGNQNCISDPATDYNGKISIERRGSTSQSAFPKNPYGFSPVDANNITINASILGMPSENDWILYSPYSEKTFMPNYIVYNLARELGWYSSRTRYVELVIDGNYEGVYILLEKIKQDKNRVDIEKITPTMNSGDSLTGGYIVKVDKTTGNSGGGWNSNQGVFYQKHDPDWDVITPQQDNYIVNYINTFEQALFSPNFANPETGYRKYSNPYSFIDFFIINEMSNNIDGYRLSTFLYKDRDSKCGKLTIGPYWDFNLSFGNGNYCNGGPWQDWQMYPPGCGERTTIYIDRMLQDPWFKNQLNCRWNQLRQNTLSNATLLFNIDTLANYLRQPASRDSARWQTIGVPIWPNNNVSNTWQGEVDYLKLWLTNRLAWMDANMYPSTQACNAVNSSQIVISEINFHSDETRDAGDWIELYNFGSTSVNLSYAYLKDDNSYNKYCVLPNNFILQAGERKVIYADSSKFTSEHPTVLNKYGPLCFKLNNAGQKIELYDKDNRWITSVTYGDYNPWQCSADGNGRTLELSSPSANPNLASSWFAGCVGGSPGNAFSPCNEKIIYSELNYNSLLTADAGDWVELYNNSSSAIDLNNWTLKDGGNNSFTFSGTSNINSNQYLVVFSDAIKFSNRFPLVNNIKGPTNFGFSSNGDVIKLYNASGKIENSLCFYASSPWPTDANGIGKTMENNQYNGNANEATTWFAGCPEGSPGKVYDPNCGAAFVNEFEENEFIKVFPNPSKGIFTIESLQPISFVRVFDLQGKMILESKEKTIDATKLSAGIYLLKINLLNDKIFYKRIVKE